MPLSWHPSRAVAKKPEKLLKPLELNYRIGLILGAVIAALIYEYVILRTWRGRQEMA